ncbi:MAG: DUF1254 domain-containing protein [Acidobacteria bacterium]|nr:DUF1254 domain-containing protein [Acidobacteriota bacterium]
MMVDSSEKMATTIDAAEARAIAKEAYIYGYPMVDSYRIQYAYFVDTKNPEYKTGWNTLCNIPRVYTPDDKAVQTPNSDTPYSMIGFDLRAEPVVLTVPVIEEGRYFSIQLVDAYTFNFAYIGSRATGNGGGVFLIAGPTWKGETPAGVTQVIRSETEFNLAIYRTQLFNTADLDNVIKIQAGYKAETLSAFLGKPAPAPLPAVDFIEPLTPEAQKSSTDVFNVLNFLLQYCPTHDSEIDLRARFAKIGIGGGLSFDLSGFSPEVAEAVKSGIGDAWADFAVLKEKVGAHEVTSNDVFGTREHLNNNYLYRMTAAILGIFGNTAAEAMYPMYAVDANGNALSGTSNYTLRFEPGNSPPVNAFWSLTMYELPASLLVANPINRYLINSPMLPDLKHDADGGLTLHIQNASPGSDLESNWLPAPTGPFMVAMRLYWPKEEALNGKWTPPPVVAVQ